MRTFTRLAVFFMIPLGLACGSAPMSSLGTVGPPGPSVATSGARLKVRFVVAPGGAERFLHFVDAETGPCRLTEPPHRDERPTNCVPIAMGSLVYGDANCERPLVRTDEADQEWVTVFGNESMAAVRPGARVAISQLYFSSRRGCSPLGSPEEITNAYAIAEARAWAALPGGLFVDAEPTDELASTAFVGDDGSALLYDVVDQRSGAQCRPGRTEAGPRCVPLVDGDLMDEGLYDATCTQRYVAEYGALRVGHMGDGDEFFRLTPLDWETPVARRIDGACVVDESYQTGRKTLHLAEPYPPNEWPVVAIQSVGGPNVTADVASTDSREPLDAPWMHPSDELFETATGARCGPAWIGDTLRCVPGRTEGEKSWDNIFADSRCSSRAVAYERGATPGPYRREILSAAPPERAALPNVVMYELKERVEGGIYEALADGRCRELALEVDVYRVGAVAPGSSFETLRLERH